jgi:hypothetical protein
MSNAVIKMSNGRIRSKFARGTGKSLKDRLEQSRETLEKQKKAFALTLSSPPSKKEGER